MAADLVAETSDPFFPTGVSPESPCSFAVQIDESCIRTSAVSFPQHEWGSTYWQLLISCTALPKVIPKAPFISSLARGSHSKHALLEAINTFGHSKAESFPITLCLLSHDKACTERIHKCMPCIACLVPEVMLVYACRLWSGGQAMWLPSAEWQDQLIGSLNSIHGCHDCKLASPEPWQSRQTLPSAKSANMKPNGINAMIQC